MSAESIHNDNTVTLDQLAEVLDSGAVIQAKNLLYVQQILQFYSPDLWTKPDLWTDF